MKRQTNPHGVPNRAGRSLVAIACAVLLVPGEGILLAQSTTPPAAAAAEADDPPLTADQIDSLVAPIALYPDDLLARCSRLRRTRSSSCSFSSGWRSTRT